MNAPQRSALDPAVLEAAQAGDYGAVLRLYRMVSGRTLDQIGARGGYSASTLSRLESGRRTVRSINELRHLAHIYDVPTDLLGLATRTHDVDGSTLTATTDEGSDVHRRTFLAGAAAVGVSATLPGAAEAAPADAGTIEEVLFGRFTAEPLPPQQLAAQIGAARADFRAARYARVSRRLPRLLAQATAGRDAAGIGELSAASERLAKAYGVATDLLIKMHDNGMACATADRAVQAATAGGSALILARNQALAAMALRRIDHRDTAQNLVLDAAAHLQDITGLPDAEHRATYAKLLAVAAYTAAIRDDRDTAWTLLTEASTATSAGHTTATFDTTELAVYRISVARRLGDYGAAVEYARRVDIRGIVAPERRARYWEDTALALHGRGRPAGCFDALLAAERDVPEEVRYRPWAQELTRELLSSKSVHGLSGVRHFATRIGVS